MAKTCKEEGQEFVRYVNIVYKRWRGQNIYIYIYVRTKELEYYTTEIVGLDSEKGDRWLQDSIKRLFTVCCTL